ncbi:MAG TPA: DUF1553 domain-containing protein, partial [Anseongella sp.]|nr:DUF1553 domain-containing protein [Anseongella sp.]
FTPMYPDSALASNRLPPVVPEHMPFARASLVENDPFLKALGRPTRETVTTSRTSQASLLQALELTNGQKFTQTLHKGASEWKSRYATTDSLVSALYQRALGRPPLPEEMEAARTVMSDTPSEESIQDLVWALMLVPEFQLIH